jgi:hypothetical protein
LIRAGAAPDSSEIEAPYTVWNAQLDESGRVIPDVARWRGPYKSAGSARYFAFLRHFSIMAARPQLELGAPTGAAE